MLLEDRGNYRKTRERMHEISDWLKQRKKVETPRIIAETPVRRKTDPFKIHEPYFVSRLNRYYFERLVTRAKEHGVSVVLCQPPYLDEYYYDRSNNDRISSYLLFINSLAESHEHVYLLTPDLYVVSPPDLYDTDDHLNEEASAEFTRFVVQKIIDAGLDNS